MRLNITYSLKEELIETIQMVFHPNEYKNLRSVILPSPITLLKLTTSKQKSINEISEIWGNIASQVNTLFKKHKLKNLNNVTCYLHNISCEGWFNVDTNSIHLRVTEYDNSRNLVDTIIHELLHLATFDENQSYEERENLVDKYLQNPDFKNLSKNSNLPKSKLT